MTTKTKHCCGRSSVFQTVCFPVMLILSGWDYDTQMDVCHFSIFRVWDLCPIGHEGSILCLVCLHEPPRSLVRVNLLTIHLSFHSGVIISSGGSLWNERNYFLSSLHFSKSFETNVPIIGSLSSISQSRLACPQRKTRINVPLMFMIHLGEG